MANLLLHAIDREIGHAYCRIVSVLFHICEPLKECKCGYTSNTIHGASTTDYS